MYDNTPATFDPARFANIIGLGKGGHDGGYSWDAKAIAVANKKVCVMEAVSYVCNLAWTDHPTCVDPWLMGIGIWINDHCGTIAIRNKLIPLIPKLVNSRFVSPDIQLIRYRTALNLTLTQLVLPMLRRAAEVNAESALYQAEIAWYDATILAEPDLDTRIALLRERAAQHGSGNDKIADPDGWPRKYIAAAYAPILNFFDYMDRITMTPNLLIDSYNDQSKTYWPTVISLYAAVLSVRDDVAEAKAEVAEVAAIEIGATVKEQLAAKLRTLAPERVLVEA